jgi:hypothetical protein
MGVFGLTFFGLKTYFNMGKAKNKSFKNKVKID